MEIIHIDVCAKPNDDWGLLRVGLDGRKTLYFPRNFDLQPDFSGANSGNRAIDVKFFGILQFQSQIWQHLEQLWNQRHYTCIYSLCLVSLKTLRYRLFIGFELERQDSSVASGRNHLPANIPHIFANYNQETYCNWVLLGDICFPSFELRISSSWKTSTTLIMVPCLLCFVLYCGLFLLGLRAALSWSFYSRITSRHPWRASQFLCPFVVNQVIAPHW